MSKSCIGCPSAMPGYEAAQFFGKNMGQMVCARFGKPIGTMNSNERETANSAKAIAATCADHGKPRPTAPDWSKADFEVAMPDPEVLKFNRRRQQDLVRNCGSCEHFVREDIVAKELGFATGLCSAKGKLILPSRGTFEGRDCDLRSLATSGVRTDVTGLTMMPEYTLGVHMSADPVKYHKQQNAKGFVDPVDYPTDREVTEDESNGGIRAWRLIKDPVTSNETFLPIYRIDFFSPEEQAKIPRTGDDEHAEDYLDHGFFTYKVAVLWRELDETPAAWGQAGVGKTEFGRYMAWLMCLPFERISITGSSEVEDLLGKTMFSPELGTYWQDGRLSQAWSKPCVLLVDEPNVGPPDVYQAMRPLMDNSKQLVLDQHDGQARERHDGVHLLVAMNPAWDPKNVGTHVISDADANRMMHLSFLLPPPELERSILTKACSHDSYNIAKETLDVIMSVAADVRALVDEDTLPITWGIRPQLKVARASRWFDLMSCYRMATADFLDPKEAEVLMDVVRSHVE